MAGVRRMLCLNENLRICLEREQIWFYDTASGRAIRLREWGKGSNDNQSDSIDVCQFSERKQILRNREESEKISRQDLEHFVSLSGKGAYLAEKILALKVVPIGSTSSLLPLEYTIHLLSSLGVLYSYSISLQNMCTQTLATQFAAMGHSSTSQDVQKQDQKPHILFKKIYMKELESPITTIRRVEII